MLKDIIKKEILDHLLSAKFLFMFIICFVLILLSVYMGAGSYLADKKIYDDDIAWDMQAWAPPNTYSMLLQGSIKTYRAPQTLGALVKGVEDAAGRVSHTVLEQEVNLGESKYESNPLAAVFGAFDLIFIVKMALSLFAILLIYDAICGEREKGTLKLSLSNSVPRDKLLLGKFIGGYISLCVPLLLPMLIGLIYLSLHPSIVLAGEDWQRIGFIFLLFLLYLTVFFCLGLLVSSLTVRSATSLIVLLFIWSVWGIVVPKVAVIVAGHLRPIPVATEIYAQKTASSSQIIKDLEPRQEELLAQANIKKVQIGSGYSIQGDYQAYQAAMTKYNEERDRMIAEQNEKIDRDFLLKKDAQAALAKNISRISPASSLTFGATSLARTGVSDYTRFWKAALDYKPVVFNWVRTNPELRDEKGAWKPMDSAVITAGMPQIALKYDNLSQTVVRILPDLISMIVMIILLTGGAYFAFIRCDVR